MEDSFTQSAATIFSGKVYWVDSQSGSTDIYTLDMGGSCSIDLGDCADDDADISPVAEEVCDDEIDNNCNGDVDTDCVEVACENCSAVKEVVVDCTETWDCSNVEWSSCVNRSSTRDLTLCLVVPENELCFAEEYLPESGKSCSSEETTVAVEDAFVSSVESEQKIASNEIEEMPFFSWLNIFLVIVLLALMVGVVGVIIFVEQGQRRIPVQYAKRIVGRKMYGGQSTHLPLKINTSGVIPPIFASSIMMFPATIASFIKIEWMQNFAQALTPGGVIYELLFVGLIFFFCYFYTAVTFNPVDVSENMKKHGGYIPGIRPGKRTADYIDRVLTRITLGGAIYVSCVCVLPSVLITQVNVPFYFGGTALLIVVGVAIDTISQIESHMISRHYEGFLKKGGARIKGRF